MAFYYLDTSAVVKFYVPEPGQRRVRQIIEARDPQTGRWSHYVFLSEIARLEVAAGLAKIARMGRISATDRDYLYLRFMHDFVHRYQIIPIRGADIELATILVRRHPLRAYDALHLATAVDHHRALIGLGYSLIFVTSDQALRAAAELEGLPTEDPQDMTPPSEYPSI